MSARARNWTDAIHPRWVVLYATNMTASLFAIGMKFIRDDYFAVGVWSGILIVALFIVVMPIGYYIIDLEGSA